MRASLCLPRLQSLCTLCFTARCKAVVWADIYEMGRLKIIRRYHNMLNFQIVHQIHFFKISQAQTTTAMPSKCRRVVRYSVTNKVCFPPIMYSYVCERFLLTRRITCLFVDNALLTNSAPTRLTTSTIPRQSLWPIQPSAGRPLYASPLPVFSPSRPCPILRLTAGLCSKCPCHRCLSGTGSL